VAHVALSQIKQRGQTSRASCLVPGSHAYRLFLATALTAEALARQSHAALASSRENGL
jgi:hypothetical protein